MSDLHVHQASTLSEQERAVLEKLVGHKLADEEAVSVRTYRIKLAPTGEAREKAARDLRGSMDALAAQVAPDATADELNALIDEAVDAVRHGRG